MPMSLSFLCVLTVTEVADLRAPASGPTLKKLTEFDLPGPSGKRFDYACYSGAISVFHQDDPNHCTKIQDFKVPHAGHTLAVDLQTYRVDAPEQKLTASR